MAVIIKKSSASDGAWYEVADFQSYAEELHKKGIKAPAAQYRIFVSRETEQAMKKSVIDLDSQLGLFFRLGPGSGIDFVVR